MIVILVKLYCIAKFSFTFVINCVFGNLQLLIVFITDLWGRIWVLFLLYFTIIALLLIFYTFILNCISDRVRLKLSIIHITGFYYNLFCYCKLLVLSYIYLKLLLFLCRLLAGHMTENTERIRITDATSDQQSIIRTEIRWTS